MAVLVDGRLPDKIRLAGIWAMQNQAKPSATVVLQLFYGCSDMFHHVARHDGTTEGRGDHNQDRGGL